MDRRLLQGQKIAASEKVYSLFEPHTEWIAKGKLHPNVELGHRLLIATDQHGRKNPTETEREQSRKFVALRQAHSAVESDINALEHHGLDRCLDVGLEGFKRYVGYGVLAFNLHQIGRELLERQRTGLPLSRYKNGQFPARHYLRDTTLGMHVGFPFQAGHFLQIIDPFT